MTHPEQFLIRQKALETYINTFVEENRKQENRVLSIDIEQAAENICSLYFRYLEEVVRPVVDGGIIEQYKVIAYMELAVLRVEPIALSGSADQEMTALYNAKLALHISICVLLDWNDINLVKFEELIRTDIQIAAFLAEHLTWMASLDTRYYFPGFSNAQIWRLFHYLIVDRIKSA